MSLEKKIDIQVSEKCLDNPGPSTTTRKETHHSIIHVSNDYAHVEHHAIVKTLLSIGDILLASSPVIFLAIACAAIAYHGKPQDKRNLIQTVDTVTGQLVLREATGFQRFLSARGGNIVITAASVAVSILPIIFAAIVGRFLKSYSIYRAERGASIGMLEQLYGSQNLFSAAQLTYALRGSGFIGLGCVFLWLLSPLGGQATQRVLGKSIAYNDSKSAVYYTDTAALNGQWNNHFAMGMKQEITPALLSGALLTDPFTSTNDIYGNPKIPFFEGLSQTGHAPGDVNSVLVQPGSPSSSLIGLVINNVTNTTASVFWTRTSYVSMTCESPRIWNYSGVCNRADKYVKPTQDELQPYLDFIAWANLISGPPSTYDDSVTTAYDSSTSGIDNTNSSITNFTITDSGVIESDSSDASNSNSTTLSGDGFWQKWNWNIGVQSNGSSNYTGRTTFNDPPTFVYSARAYDTCLITAYKCSSRVTWVESAMYCSPGGQCVVNSMEKIDRPDDSIADGIFYQNYADQHVNGLPAMLGDLNSYSGNGVAQSPIVSPIEHFLSGSPYSFENGNGATTFPDYSKVSVGTIAQRLATLLNTYWMAGLQSTATAQPSITNASLILASYSNSTTYQSSMGLGYDVRKADATFWTATDVYAVSWPFVTIAIIVSLILLAFGFLGLYLRRLTSLPDILSSVSALTRDNPHFNAPVDEDKTGGMELAAYYKSVRVQLTSTADTSEGGRIILRPLQKHSTV